MINIQEYQIKKKEDEIVNKALLNGDIVTSFDVITKLNNFFNYKTAGLPYYKNIRLKPHSKSDPTVWNNSFKELGEDLEVAYEIYNNQEKAVLEAKSSFDSEILSLYKEFDELNSEIELANIFSNKGIVYYPYIINFNDLKDINSENLYDHNIPYTNCEVDFDKSLMRNELHSTPNDKIDLSKSAISITTPSKNLASNKDVKAIVSENSTEVVTVETRSQNDKNQELHIDVRLDRPYEMSKIDLSCFNISNAKAVLLVSDDNENYIELEVQNGYKYISWVFNKRKVSRFKIIIRKNKNDIEVDETSICIYSIVNISAYNDKYNTSGVFTSNVVRFDEAITDVCIYPTHSMPPMTDISYFIGYEDKNNDIEWYPIKPYEMFDLNLLYKNEMILNYVTSDIFGRWDFDRETKKRLFYIHEIPDNTNLNSIYLRAGHSQWLIERLDVTPKYEEDHPKDKKVNINDYSKSYVTAMSPLDMSMTEIRCEKEWNYFVMSSYVVCDKETIIEDRFMTYEFTLDEEGNPNETLDLALIVNGRRIFAKDGKFSFRLRKGENLIRLMVLFGNQDVSDIEHLKCITHNFNLLSSDNEVFAGPKMERMSYNALERYTSEKDLKHYAIKTVGTKDYIVTKFDPNYVLSPFDPYGTPEKADGKNKIVPTADSNDDAIGSPPTYDPPNIYMNNSEYMRMYTKFRHMLPTTLEKITNKDRDSSIRLRVMARLTSSDISVSPTITRIKVVGI